MSFKDKLKSANLKKLVKFATIIVGISLIIFVSLFHATFDFAHIDWGDLFANEAIIVGIIIFGVLMGTSIGTDAQKEKVGGLYQTNCDTYLQTILLIESIKIYFSQFWLWYKNKTLIEKKIDFLTKNKFDPRVAKIIVKNIEKEDLEYGKLIYDIKYPKDKIYTKNGVDIKKLEYDDIQIVSQMISMTLDTYEYGYFLYLFDEDEITATNEAEKGKKIKKKIDHDKKMTFIIRITSSFIFSLVWTALTIKEFIGDNKQQVWFNLLSRLAALALSFGSGYSTAVINVKDQARAIENKVNVLKDFKTYTEKGIFVPETYEQMIQREKQEQESVDLVVE